MDGVIEGSVQRENGRVKVMIQLIHGPSDTHLWAHDYERAMTDVLKLQGEMARAIANEIRIQVTPEERSRLASRRAVNPAAHEAYLLGRFHYWKFIIDDHKRAIDHFERATRIDPGYAAAYAGLSLAWQKWGTQRLAKLKEFEPQARAAARRALELDDRLSEAHVAQGHLQFFYDWDWSGGEKSIRRAIELDPNNLDAHYNYAFLLRRSGVSRKRLPKSKPLNIWTRSLTKSNPFSDIFCIALGNLTKRSRVSSRRSNGSPAAPTLTMAWAWSMSRWASTPRR